MNEADGAEDDLSIKHFFFIDYAVEKQVSK